MEGFNVITLTGPSWLATWLVNGNTCADGLTSQVKDNVRHQLRKHGVSVVDCVAAEDAGFVKNPDFGEAGDCQTYTFHQPHGMN
jgi:hypothetical protein